MGQEPLSQSGLQSGRFHDVRGDLLSAGEESSLIATSVHGADGTGGRRWEGATALLHWRLLIRAEELSVAVQLVQVTDSQFQNVGLLQLRQVFPFGRQGGAHEILELVEAPVDPCATLPLQERFRDLFEEILFFIGVQELGRVSVYFNVR